MMLNNFRHTMQWNDNFSYAHLPLTLENMIGMVGKMWVVLESQGKDIELADELAEEVRGEMVEGYVPGSDFVFFYREGESLNSLLRNSVTYLPASSMKVDDISSILDELIEVVQFHFDMALDGTLPGKTIDTNGFQQQNRSFAVANMGMGQGEDEQGWTYLWAPFYIVNQDKSIFKNTVYLVLFRSAADADAETVERYGIEPKGNNRWEAYIIADQERVGAFLAEQVLLAMKKGHPLENEKEIDGHLLKNEPFISMNEGTSIHSLTRQACADMGFQPHIAIQSDDPFYIRRCVELGLAIAVVPSISWRGQFSDDIVLRKIPNIERVTCLCRNKKTPLTDNIKLFSEIVAEQFNKEKL